MFEGAINRQRMEWKRAAYQAWHAGAIGRAKKPPKLQSMMEDFEPKPVMSAEDVRRALLTMAGKSDGEE